MLDQRPRVSLCMIVRDEERNLADSLAPVAALFDEIIIVDTGSIDRTKEIAYRFTPHVYDFVWCNDFSAARNECLKYTTGEWIFWLDADDRIRPEHLPELRRLLTSELTEWPRVFLMNVVLLPASSSDEPGLVTHARLFPRAPKTRWKGRIHEQLQLDDSAPHEQVFASVLIEHVGYQDTSRQEARTQRNLPLLRLDHHDDPHNRSTLLQLGYALADLDRAEARQHLHRLIELEHGRSPILRATYYLLAEIAIKDGDMRAATDYANRGLALFPDEPRLLYARALAEFAAENYADAASLLQRAIAQAPARQIEYGTSHHVQSKVAPRMLASVRRLQRDFREAERLLVAVLVQFPDDVLSWYNLGLIYVDEVQLDKFAGVVRQLLKLPAGGIESGLLTALWSLRNGEASTAGPLIDQLIAEAPDRPQPRMLRAELLSRLQAPVAAQIEALRNLLQVEPNNVEARRWLATLVKTPPPS